MAGRFDICPTSVICRTSAGPADCIMPPVLAASPSPARRQTVSVQAVTSGTPAPPTTPPVPTSRTTRPRTVPTALCAMRRSAADSSTSGPLNALVNRLTDPVHPHPMPLEDRLSGPSSVPLLERIEAPPPPSLASRLSDPPRRPLATQLTDPPAQSRILLPLRIAPILPLCLSPELPEGEGSEEPSSKRARRELPERSALEDGEVLEDEPEEKKKRKAQQGHRSGQIARENEPRRVEQAAQIMAVVETAEVTGDTDLLNWVPTLQAVAEAEEVEDMEMEEEFVEDENVPSWAWLGEADESGPVASPSR
ncbi:hypothetical protein DFH07DRAFT_785234 [Mycena maculata]|uniref:Uncharacterized protein n=1 Tax=Mycena maculata TaxID=230809 RepID=A0AAD7HCE6_9AGAR|nr:hypothetical protein DFH07DRAFT_785234 [Mycena maculata]